MKVVLVQLPVPNNRYANLPLALGYLKAAAEAARIEGLKVVLLEAPAQNRGGDAFVVDAILAHDPDLVGFSLYTWNSSRSLGLARALKRRAPEVLILGGGPEINLDGDFVLAAPDFDFLVQGEGERAFVALLRRLSAGYGRVGARKPGVLDFGGSSHGFSNLLPSEPPLEDVNLAPSAYLSGALEGHLGRFMSIELSRWCPSRCTFCYYGRQDWPRGGKRYFDLERIRQELLFGMERGAEQIHFVEANFNTLPHLDQLYELIRATGANRRMRFYAELRGEAINPAHAETLAACNFSTVEVGLQSAVPEVLARVKRKNHLTRLVQGVHNLRGQGIEVFLDVILGLPGETPATFERTLGFIEQNDLQPYDLFHLQILPGTQLKTEALAGQHGMRWQPAPPYFVLETADLSFETLRELRRATLLRKGEDPAGISGLPQPGAFALAASDKAEIGQAGEVLNRPYPVERVILDFERGQVGTGRAEWTELARKLGSEVTLWLKLGPAGDAVLEQARTALRALSEPNPSGMWHLFVEAARPLNQTEEQTLREAIYHEEGYLDRLAVFARPPSGRVDWPSVNFYQLRPYRRGFKEKVEAGTVWQVSMAAEDTVEDWRNLLGEALAAGGAGLALGTYPGCPPGRVKAAFTGLDFGTGQLWFADTGLAAGWAAFAAPDNAEALTSLDYPLTAFWQGNTLSYSSMASSRLERAAIRFQI